MKPIRYTKNQGVNTLLLVTGLLLGLLSNVTTGQAQNFHLLVFADTDDPGLSAPNLMNVAYLTELADSVCRRTGMTNRMVVYKGSEFVASRCDQVLSALRPEPNDVVFFYFMGHGWNNSETEEPMLLFKTQGQSPGETNSRNLKAVFEQLQRKGNRLTLAFGESCNSAINDRARAKKGSGAVMNVSVFSADQLRNLFLRSRMSILLHTCKRNQKSNSSEDGGWFFTSFLDQFKQAVSPRNRQPAGWETLLQASARATTEYAHEQGAVQEPVFRIVTNDAPVVQAAVVEQANHLTASSPPKPAARTPKAVPATEPASTADNVCPINRTAFNAMRGHLKFLEEYSAELEPMDPEVAADKFRKYYSADRQDFFQHLPQKLNVTRLDPADAGVFSTEGEETATLLDDIAYYLDDPQFKTNARGKLSSVTASLRVMIARVQDLLRQCRE